MPSSKSEQMSRVRGRHTEPELLLRRLLSARGVHYRLHRSDLPGRPDVYVGRLRLALFVNGCFWHGHDCKRGRRPATNVVFWTAKIARNVQRDAKALRELDELGIATRVLWTCRTRDFVKTADDIADAYQAASGRTCEVSLQQ